MIADILINNSIVDGKLRAVVYPTRGDLNPRVYVEPTESSCKRLEKMMRKHNVRPYLLTRGVSIWIAR